jgi:hypothetical protein
VFHLRYCRPNLARALGFASTLPDDALVSMTIGAAADERLGGTSSHVRTMMEPDRPTDALGPSFETGCDSLLPPVLSPIGLVGSPLRGGRT